MRSSQGLAAGSNGFGRGHSLLEQNNPAFSENRPLSLIQSQVDGLVGGFVSQATDWRALAAMTAGGLAYRAGRMGVMGLGGGSSVLRVASVGLGLTAEVSAFEFSHRVLESGSENPRLWRWSSSGGLAQGLLQSFITFGTLKGAGRLAQGENFIAQHLFQDSAMVLGHQVGDAFGLGPRLSGSLAEQFLHAEATNLQMGAGMALAHGMAPGILRAGTISDPADTVRERPPTSFEDSLAYAMPLGSSRRVSSGEIGGGRIRENLSAMSSIGEGDGPFSKGSSSAPPRVSRTLPPAAPETKRDPFAYELHLEDFSRFQNNGHEAVIAVREGREFVVKVGHRERTKRWDRYFPAGTTKITFQLKEGPTLGRAVVYLEADSINLYSISNQASKNARKMSPGAGTIFLDWLATQAALQGKFFNIIRVENTHIFRILSRSQLVDPRESVIEGCLWKKEGYQVLNSTEWGNMELIDHYEGGHYHFLNVRARPNPSLLPPLSQEPSN